MGLFVLFHTSLDLKEIFSLFYGLIRRRSFITLLNELKFLADI